MMRFSGYTFDSDLAKRNKNLHLITDPDEYNKLAISLIDPNYRYDSGYTIPKVISPYKLHAKTMSQHQYLQCLINLFDMIVMALRILFTMIKKALSLDQHPLSTIRPN